ncbi:MAG: hypothetical protein GY866_32195 [Proteobacteria bacterium]|nr:hypothetical protein [Pseudomonadota bacterium]
MGFGKPDRVPYFEEGVRTEVLEAWQNQGLQENTPLTDLFLFDRREEIAADLDPLPRFEKWPGSSSELDILERSLDAGDPRRMPEGWPEKYRKSRKQGQIIMLRVHQGLFLSMGIYDWRRFTETLFLLADDPKFVREAMAIQGRFAADLAEKVLREVEVDAAVFGEPISGNDRALISPKMYETFALASYEPIFEVLKRHGVETLILRTYGNSKVLIPSALKWGINCLWASETNREAMDYRKLRREFGRDLRLIGGIDLDALRFGKAAIRREIEETVPPLLADGGYIPLADGRVREEISFENYRYYRGLLEQVVGRRY